MKQTGNDSVFEKLQEAIELFLESNSLILDEEGEWTNQPLYDAFSIIVDLVIHWNSLIGFEDKEKYQEEIAQEAWFKNDATEKPQQKQKGRKPT